MRFINITMTTLTYWLYLWQEQGTYCWNWDSKFVRISLVSVKVNQYIKLKFSGPPWIPVSLSQRVSSAYWQWYEGAVCITSSRGQPSTIQSKEAYTEQLKWLIFESVAVSDAGHIFSSGPRQSFVLPIARRWCYNMSNRPVIFPLPNSKWQYRSINATLLALREVVIRRKNQWMLWARLIYKPPARGHDGRERAHRDFSPSGFLITAAPHTHTHIFLAKFCIRPMCVNRTLEGWKSRSFPPFSP